MQGFEAQKVLQELTKYRRFHVLAVELPSDIHVDWHNDENTLIRAASSSNKLVKIAALPLFREKRTGRPIRYS